MCPQDQGTPPLAFETWLDRMAKLLQLSARPLLSNMENLA
jgi:hypothetical protein